MALSDEMLECDRYTKLFGPSVQVIYYSDFLSTWGGVWSSVSEKTLITSCINTEFPFNTHKR